MSGYILSYKGIISEPQCIVNFDNNFNQSDDYQYVLASYNCKYKFDYQSYEHTYTFVTEQDYILFYYEMELK